MEPKEGYNSLSRNKQSLHRMPGNRSYSNPHSKSNPAQKKQNITFLLISADTFGLSIGYNLMTAALKTYIKNNYSASWNNDFKVWQMPFEHYKPCINYFKQYAERQVKGANVNKIPDFAFNAQEQMPLDLEIKNSPYEVTKVIKYNQLEVNIEPRALPFYYKLYDFQKESLDFGIKKHGRLLLADEMGVGKTIQSIAIASIYRHQWPFAVICPSSLRLNWQQQILTWLSDYLKKSQIQVYSKGGTPIRQNVKAFIVSYDLAWKIKNMMEPFKVVIADEAHYLKNTGNKRSDVLLPFLSSRKRIILLSGTPALAKPREIYNLLSIVRPDLFVNFKQFGYRYCDPTVNPWSRALQYNGCQNGRQLYHIINNRIMIRRLKKDVLTQLPDKQRQQIHVQTDKSIIKQIRELLSNCGGEGKMEDVVMEMLCQFDSGGNEAKDMRQAITQAYTLTGQAKLNSVKDYVLELLNNDIKILIFGHHIHMLDGLEQALESKKIKYIRIDGSVTKQKRHEAVTKFQEDPSVSAAILSITAAGVGLTLTAASTVVFAQLHWTPGMMVQAQDRAHRIGQKCSVNCHYLLGQNSLDDILYRNLEKKIHNVSSFVDGKSQKLQIEKVSKGEKGKVSRNCQENTNSNKNPSILFKFESIKPIVDKYYTETQSDISRVGTDPNESDIEESVKVTKKTVKSKKEPVQIEERQTILEQVHAEASKKKYNEQRESENVQKSQNWQKQDQQEQMQRYNTKSSQLCSFILQNADELLKYSQSQPDSQQTRSLS